MRDAGIPRKMRGKKFPIFLANEISRIKREETKKVITHLGNGYKFSGGRLERWDYNNEEWEYIEFDPLLTREDIAEITSKIENLGFNAQVTIGRLFSFIEEREINDQGISTSCQGRGIEYNLDGLELKTGHVNDWNSNETMILNRDDFDLNRKIEVKFVGFAGSEVFADDIAEYFGIKFPNIHKWK